MRDGWNQNEIGGDQGSDLRVFRLGARSSTRASKPAPAPSCWAVLHRSFHRDRPSLSLDLSPGSIHRFAYACTQSAKGLRRSTTAQPRALGLVEHAGNAQGVEIDQQRAVPVRPVRCRWSRRWSSWPRPFLIRNRPYLVVINFFRPGLAHGEGVFRSAFSVPENCSRTGQISRVCAWMSCTPGCDRPPSASSTLTGGHLWRGPASTSRAVRTGPPSSAPGGA